MDKETSQACLVPIYIDNVLAIDTNNHIPNYWTKILNQTHPYIELKADNYGACFHIHIYLALY